VEQLCTLRARHAAEKAHAGDVAARTVQAEDVAVRERIVFTAGNSLTIETCIVRNLSSGVVFAPSGSSRLAVSSTVVANNGINGIIVAPEGSGVVTAALDRVEAYHQGLDGIIISGTAATGGSITAVATNSVAAGNVIGFNVLGGVPTILTVVNSVSANNGIGLHASGLSTLRLAGSTLIDNPTHGWQIDNGALIETFGDNNIRGNGANTGPLTPISKQ